MSTASSNAGQGLATHAIARPHGRIHVADRSGLEPTAVLMHGFPDDSRIYDRVVGLLAPRRVVSFDFLGYGRSDRVDPSALEPGHAEQELDAVLDGLGIERAILVAHDASGPVAIDHARREPARVERLVLLNTYFGRAPSLRFPEMIRLLADPDLVPLADALLDDPDQRLWLLGHTARRFGIDPVDPDGIGVTAVLPQFFGDAEHPDALAAIRRWTANLFRELDRQDAIIATGDLAELDVPVSLVFGAGDEYLNPDLARHLATLFAAASVTIVEGAGHWPQWDRPEQVAEHIRR